MTDYSSTSPPPISPEDFSWIVRNGLYFHVVATTIVLYDHITTIDLEVELVWKKKLSLVQLLYFVNRYTGDALFLYGCVGSKFPHVQTWLAMISLSAMQAIMVHRIVCMYRRQKAILVGLLLALSLLYVAAVVSNVQFTLLISSVPVTLTPTLQTCLPLGFPTWSTVLWFIIIAFDLIIFGLALREGLRFRRETSSLPPRSPQEVSILRGAPWLKKGNLMRILLRDSIVFPFLTILSSLFVILAWYKIPAPALQIAMNTAGLFSPVLGCRLILNLRDAYYRPFVDEVRETMIERSPQHQHEDWPIFQSHSDDVDPYFDPS